MGLKTNQNAGRGSMGEAMDRARQQQAGAQGGAQQESSQRFEQQTQQQPSPNFGASSFFSGMAMPAAANPAAETLSRMRNAFDEIYAAQKDQVFDVTLIPIDNEAPGINLAVSVLVVAVQYKQAKQLGVGYHALLLEATGDSIPPLAVPVPQGQPLSMTRTVGDAYDNIMQSTIESEVAKAFPSTPLYNADANSVERDFNLNDKALLQRLAANSVIASATELGKHQEGYQPFTISGNRGDTSLSVNTTFGNPATADTKGHPIRSDVVMKFRTGPVRQQQPGQNQSLNLEKPQDIATLTSYVDLVHEPKSNPNAFYAAAQQAMNPQQALERFRQFYARLTITQMKVGRNMTLPMQLMGLAVANTMREPGAWFGQFRQPYRNRGQQQASQVDLKDIGVIGLELPPLDPANPVQAHIETKSETFTEQNLAELLSMATHPGIILTLDVPDCGDETWYNGIFARAAMGDIDANREICHAADVLTGGAFGEVYKGNGIVATNEDNRKQLGQYKDHEGVWRDLRDFDYIAAANLFELNHDRTGARDWSATFLQTQYPIEQRLAARERIMRGFFEQVEITGYATPVTFMSDFLDALMQAIDMNKLRITEVSPFADAAAYDLPRYQFAASTLASTMQSPVFQRGFGNQRGNQGYRPMGRWS
jgi:hypothetical protein